jgi:hypothetical protein
MTVSSDVTGFPGISVTASSKALNTFQDLTSNKLESAGLTNATDIVPQITVFDENKHIHIRCEQPEMLPPHVEILNIAGQRLGLFEIDKTEENIVPHHLRPGFYFIAISTGNQPQVLRFVVL